MAKSGVKWRDICRFCRNTEGYRIVHKGGDALIKGPGGRTAVIGHKFSNSPNDELSAGHLSLLKRKFGITKDDILNA